MLIYYDKDITNVTKSRQTKINLTGFDQDNVENLGLRCKTRLPKRAGTSVQNYPFPLLVSALSNTNNRTSLFPMNFCLKGQGKN